MRLYTNSIGVAAVAVWLAACGSLKLAPDVYVDGKYPFTESDEREIERLLPGTGIKGPISSISTYGPDEAGFTAGHVRYHGREGYRYEFTAQRRFGRWHIDRSSIHSTYNYPTD